MIQRIRRLVDVLGLLQQGKRDDELRALLAGLPDFGGIDFGSRPEAMKLVLDVFVAEARRLGMPDELRELEAAVARIEKEPRPKKIPK